MTHKLIVFLDYANIDHTATNRGLSLDYGALLNYLAEGRFLAEAHVFVPRDPHAPYARDRAIEDLWQQGYLVHDKIGIPRGDSYKCDFDVEITLEMMRSAELAHPDIVVLASGDGDFLPVARELRRRAIRVEVAAFPEHVARNLRLQASGYINLERWIQEISDSEKTEDTAIGSSENEKTDDRIHAQEIPAANDFSIPTARVWSDDRNRFLKESTTSCVESVN